MALLQALQSVLNPDTNSYGKEVLPLLDGLIKPSDPSTDHTRTMLRLWSPAPSALALLLLLSRLCGAQLQEAAGKPGLVELATDSLVASMKALPEDRWVLVEFYAHWCPACQHFQPEYEKVAAFFAERGEKEPVVTVVRLDCANSAEMCSAFKVSGYPSMKLGTASDLAALALDKLVDVQPASRHADSIIAFLATHLDVTFEAAIAAVGGGSSGSGSESRGSSSGDVAHGATNRKLDPGRGKTERLEALEQGHVAAGGTGVGAGATAGAGAGAGVDLNDVEGATIKSWQYIIASPLLLKGPEARQGLQDWVELLAGSHPVKRCRAGAERLAEALGELWPNDADQPQEGLADVAICPGSTFSDWRGCHASSPDRRGYTCGLWQLFHTLAARLPEVENSGAVWLAAVKGFVGNYFQCTECATHFMQHAARNEALQVADKRSACLWMWQAHNIVNRRLATKDEAADTVPHIQFPPTMLCRTCRRAEGQGEAKDEAVPWDEDQVYTFLLSYYSGEQPQAEGDGGGGLRVGHSSWGDAGLVAALVAGCVYAVLRRSTQYALRKLESRSL